MPELLSPQQLVAIAAEFGSPVYIYHAEKIKEQYSKLTDAFNRKNVKFFYACKALTNVNILKYVQSLGASLDCVSVNEVKLGLLAGFSKKYFIHTQLCRL